MNYNGKRRMKKLIDFLTKLKNRKIKGMNPKRFNMNTWKTEGIYSDTPCGTAACAVGHIPDAMPRSGFRLKLTNFVRDKDGEIVHREYEPMYEKYEGMRAAAKFFNIMEEEAENLFLPQRYREAIPSLPVVIKRMKDFLKEKESE